MMATIIQSTESAFQQFAIQYEGAADKVPPSFILVLRGIIRPAITILTFLQFFAILLIGSWQSAFQHAKALGKAKVGT